MSSALRIGIDFDNTIVSYDEVFCRAARIRGLVDVAFAGRKQEVRDAVRMLPEGELAWQRLQGEVYGKGIAEASLIAGLDKFLHRCRALECSVMVVSHKTEYGHYDPDRVNLRKAAIDWMKSQGLLGDTSIIQLGDVYFESTRAEKLQRIAALSLTHFIDDLEEVLSDPGFPKSVVRILFSDDEQRSAIPYVVCPTWRDIERRIFDKACS
jgi:hypothetical protein